MKSYNFKKHQKTLQKIFQKAYFEKENTVTDNRWQAEMMRRLRVLGPPQPQISYFMVFEKLVWRLAPVTSVLILLLTAGVIKFGLMSENEIVKMFTDYPLKAVYLTWFKLF